MFMSVRTSASVCVCVCTLTRLSGHIWSARLIFFFRFSPIDLESDFPILVFFFSRLWFVFDLFMRFHKIFILKRSC